MRSTLLELACQIADSEGLDAVNIRSLAGRAGIATGTVYNYFSCKDEILLALTEEYWRQALLQMKTVITADSFCGQLLEIFTFLQEQIDRSAGKLMSSLGNIEATGHARMASMQSELISAPVVDADRAGGVPLPVGTVAPVQNMRYRSLDTSDTLPAPAPCWALGR